MSGFTAGWLALREPADAVARSMEVARLVADALAPRAQVTIVDLGTGTGANVRYLASRLRGRQRWRLVDDDPDLLEQAARAAVDAVPLHADLRVLDPTWFEGADLVTASALLDLVADEWLARLVRRCRERDAAVLFALNYDGRMRFSPGDADDGWITDLVNRHQRTDKGFGPALGPDAGRAAETALERAGYEVRRAASDWVLDGAFQELQRQLIAGCAAAARDLHPDASARIGAWLARRLACVDDGTSRTIVGHDDVAGIVR